MGKAKIYYAKVDEFWTKEQKLRHLESIDSFNDIKWEPIEPDAKHNWLLEGLHSEYEDFIPLGTKEAKSTDGVAAYAIFKLYSRGAETARDEWAYNFNIQELSQNIQSFINFYNEQVYKWENERKDGDSVDSFVSYDETKIKWSSRLKECLESGVKVDFSTGKIRQSIYRPFTRQNLYFDNVLTHRRGQFHLILPNKKSEEENQVICIVTEAQVPFSAQVANCIPCLHYGGRQTQCFPFYTYSEYGTNRCENITDWALEKF